MSDLKFECFIYGTDNRGNTYPSSYYMYDYSEGPGKAFQAYLSEYPEVCHVIIDAAIPYKEDRGG